MTEEKIVYLLQSREESVIAYLYDQYGSALFGIAVRIVRSKELAEQVLQDTFMKIWRYGAQYDKTKGRLFTWMVNIARNTAIDATRTAHFTHYSQVEDITTLYQAESAEKIQTDHIGLRNIVAQLDEKYRVLIEKIYFEGYTQQEVEEEMGIPMGTIKTRLRAAINQLRTQFAGPETLALVLFIEKLIKQ